MARHWSAYCGGLSERQAMALDKMAREHGVGDGMDLLMQLTRCSRSKVGKMDRASLSLFVDEAFERYGRARAAAAATAPDPLTQAIESGLARINGEGGVTIDAKAQALAQIRSLMAEHGITADELR